MFKSSFQALVEMSGETIAGEFVFLFLRKLHEVCVCRMPTHVCAAMPFHACQGKRGASRPSDVAYARPENCRPPRARLAVPARHLQATQVQRDNNNTRALGRSGNEASASRLRH